MERVTASPSENCPVAEIRRRGDGGNPTQQRGSRPHPKAAAGSGSFRRRERRAGVVKKTFPQVLDDFPEAALVGRRELDIIEMYLGDLVDRMLLLER
jgi:hypothetical protein